VEREACTIRTLAPALILLCALALAGCSGSGLGPSRELPDAGAPVLSGVLPRLLVPGVVQVEVDGSALALAGGSSTISVRRTSDLDGQPVTAPGQALDVQLLASGASSIFISVAVRNSSPPGLYTLRLQRSDGLVAQLPSAFVILAPLGVLVLDDVAACQRQPPQVLGISGSELPVIDGAAPQVHLSAQQVSASAFFDQTLPTTASGCVPVPASGLNIQRCTRLEAAFPSAAPPQVYEARILAPPASSPPSLFFLVDGPSPDASWPLLSAVDAPVDLDFEPSRLSASPPPGIHFDTSAPPAADLDGQPLSVQMVGCSPTSVQGHLWCARARATVPEGTAPGTHTATLTTMPGCTMTGTVRLTARPVVTAVTPTTICARGGAGFDITGSDFEDPHVLLGTMELTLSRVCVPGSPCISLSTYPDWALAAPPLPLGQYAVTVQNGSRPRVSALNVTPVMLAPGPPGIGRPEPEFVFGGTEHTVFVPLSQPVTTITAMGLWNGPTLPVQFSQRDGGVDMVIPAGLAPGGYEVVATEGSSCTGMGSEYVGILDSWQVISDDFTSGIDWRDYLQIRSQVVISSGDPTIVPQWQPDGGNLGGAVSYAFDAGVPTWWFALGAGAWSGYDLAALRFDLRAARSAGAPVVAPDVRIIAFNGELQASLAQLPGSVWGSYLLHLDRPDEWTYVDQTTTRPATIDDLHAVRDHAFFVWIRGQYADGEGETWLDNVLLDLHH